MTSIYQIIEEISHKMLKKIYSELQKPPESCAEFPSNPTDWHEENKIKIAKFEADSGLKILVCPCCKKLPYAKHTSEFSIRCDNVYCEKFPAKVT
jgi:hypothetical protein